mmetsp:Transcript_5808/g.13850  ORF Transcript_5808/g.13850 Transcript_5808/m.13850 type:complete len:122 (-) Transcript_5808:353-718(-)
MAAQTWRLLDGMPHDALLCTLREALAWQVLNRPGVTESALCAHFHLIPPLEVSMSLRALIADGQLEERRVPASSLAASPFALPETRAGAQQAGRGCEELAVPSAQRAFISAGTAHSPFLGI